jgi:two-component system response regulator AtoC
MRRQSDYSAIAELQLVRPELRILLVAQERTAVSHELANIGTNFSILDKQLNHPDSEEQIRKTLKSAFPIAIDAAVVESKLGSVSPILPYSAEFLRRVGTAEVPVLLTGETGVGKEVMARRLTAYSSRADKPFLKLNCAALPADLAESELFGYAKGAFTGASADRQGRFEAAQGGTLLLDEIGDMDLRLQTKLLQVLQDGEIQPLGSNRTVKVDVRVMAATHRDLAKGIQEGTFREDLYYRLNVIQLFIPPLRERRDEILPLAELFLERHLPPGESAPRINEQLKRFLMEYQWPGNVRELENAMRRFIVYRDPNLVLEGLRENAGELYPRKSAESVVNSILRERPGSQVAGRTSIEHEPNNSIEGLERRGTEGAERLDRLAAVSRTAEIEVLLEALETYRWNRRQAAASLQIDYKAFLYRLQKYGIVESKTKRREVGV